MSMHILLYITCHHYYIWRRRRGGGAAACNCEQWWCEHYWRADEHKGDNRRTSYALFKLL